MTGELIADGVWAAPADLSAAYAIQTEVATRLKADIAGWKVGFMPDRTPFAAPIFAHDLRGDAAVWSLGRHPLKVEVELVVRLARDVAGPIPSRAALLDNISEVYTGIELVQSRFAEPAKAPFLSRTADNFSNLGFIERDGVSAFTSIPLDKLRVRVWTGEDLRQEGVGTHQEGDPLSPVLAWLAAGPVHLGGLKAGQFITTGTLIDPIEIATPTHVRGDLEHMGSIGVHVSA
jgi:2-keto-4-pentenoate hydratase